MIEKFEVLFLEEAARFLDGLEENARNKILYNIRKAQGSNGNELFKKLTSDIWEFRTLFNKNYYRLFAFWDKTQKTETIVISTHGLIKKTPKISNREIGKAIRIRRLYFEMKYKK